MMQILYKLLARLDTIVYGVASSLFRIIFDLANTEFFKEEQITSIANRIYVIVGVLMLFKLVMSAIQYLINPDVFEDKEKGLVGVLKKSAISIALIVLVPTIFKFLIALQQPIIRTLPSVILGNEASQRVTDESIGFDLSFQVLSAFVTVNPNKTGSVGTNGEIHDFESFHDHITDGCPAFTFFGAISTEGCVYNYMIIISTLAGAFLCYMLLSMMLDIAVRTIKLGVIQMLAPIPISSYIFSKDKLNKFVKTASTVYLDLFIRMAIVYFIIFALKAMVIENNVLNIFSINGGGVSDTGDWFRGVVVNICIIFGLLQFASKAPKFISELLGLPDIGSGEMADMFKPAWQRVGGFSMASSAVGAYRNAKAFGDKHKWRRAFTAGAHAGVTRLKDVASGKSLGESYKTSKDAAMARTMKNLEYANRYSNFRERQKKKWQERWDKFGGVTTAGERANANITASNSTIDLRTHAWDRANAKSVEKRVQYGTSTILKSGKVVTWAEIERRYKELTEGGQAEAYAGEFNELESNLQRMRDEASTEYIRQAFADLEHGDSKTRNVFAEDILKIVRSGATPEVVGEIINRTVEVPEKQYDASGNVIVDAAGNPIYKKNPDGTIAKVKKEINLLDMAKKVQNNETFSAEEAELLSIVIPKMDKVGGNIRLRETSKQTSVPKS